MTNLAVNARDAIGKAGTITLETSNVACDEAYCTAHPDCVRGEYVVLSVSDDGCGMEKEILDNIFEPFFTTKKDGRGTTFRIYLPRCCGKMQEPALGKEAGEIRGGAETILIVEDEGKVLALGRDMLERLGYKVLAFRKAAEAIR